MFFRKRMKVSQFLDTLCHQLVTGEGTFVHEDFYEEFNRMLVEAGKDQWTVPSSDHDLFINRFIGTLLWLIKYRALSNMISSPRKLAYLDLSFDTVFPEVVDRYFHRYRTDIINECYELTDIECKKYYTGELQKVDKPRFLVSPLWARNPDPHPFQVAARIFLETAGQLPAKGTGEDTGRQPLFESLEKSFLTLTREAADTARKFNVT